ncbi:AAA family ATPase [Blastopirellula marina]|uniref:AAA family ATPase n=1 Tax=Blastopirellula marina TaxID=124 RepID=A0A2S8FXY4_9BACT|nr:MoxR family ATPase [Blastopirellula marina]PQO36704.1 AAA family ATPase [Blastopirellula marina]PTL44534.1 MoxR family ATPase [Blastopirellula marina]
MSSSTPNIIEFACSGCGKKLRVGQEAAGKKARCPQCDAIQVVPDKSEAIETSPTETVVPPLEPIPSEGFSTEGGDASLDNDLFSSMNEDASPAALGSAPAANTSPSMTLAGHHSDDTAFSETRELFQNITSEIAKIYVGQEELVLGTLVALFSGGHVLIESAPGLGKTLFVRTLGRVLGCDFGRVQFTADLMPSDITGAPFFDMKANEFRFRPGPIFTQLLLADEINRSPAKTHAALLEVMQEFRVTIDGTSHKIERPFLVMATQNPIESEGTYNLPEAQLDRFMFKLNLDYPSEFEEAEILKQHSQQVDIGKRLEEEIQVVTSPEKILEVTRENGNVLIADKLIDYINKIVRLTRTWPQFHLGASPRAGITLMQGARTLAAFNGRDYAVPDDVVQIALPALRHRVVLSAEAEVEGHSVDELLTELIRTIEVPRL